MNALALSAPAAQAEGGFYVGRIRIAGVPCALIVAPKADGQYPKDIVWNRSLKSVAGAGSYCDGQANTAVMAEAGSVLAKWALETHIGGFNDWYLPSIDELELCYRYLKPSTEQNYCWSRSGINVSADPPTYPYTPDEPRQTAIELFRTGAAEAFDEVAYWSSTQHASDSGRAWIQTFDNGTQDHWCKNLKLRARLVRRSPI